MKSLFRFDFRHFRGDLFGGLTAGIVALPLALAFGVSSGLGPSAGLYGAIFVSFFAALFDGTPTQISGPTAPMTAVSMVFIAEMLANFDGDVSKALPTILAVFLLAGLIQIILGFIGLGKIHSLHPLSCSLWLYDRYRCDYFSDPNCSFGRLLCQRRQQLCATI